MSQASVQRDPRPVACGPWGQGLPDRLGVGGSKLANNSIIDTVHTAIPLLVRAPPRKRGGIRQGTPTENNNVRQCRISTRRDETLAVEPTDYSPSASEASRKQQDGEQPSPRIPSPPLSKQGDL